MIGNNQCCVIMSESHSDCQIAYVPTKRNLSILTTPSSCPTWMHSPSTPMIATAGRSVDGKAKSTVWFSNIHYGKISQDTVPVCFFGLESNGLDKTGLTSEDTEAVGAAERMHKVCSTFLMCCIFAPIVFIVCLSVVDGSGIGVGGSAQ